MEKLYQEMFDEVRASGRLRQEVHNMKDMERTEAKRRRAPRAALIAAVLAIALTGTTLAAVGLPGTLKGWFTQRWSEVSGGQMPEEQAALIDSLTQAVGVSDTQNGVTVTLDSITVGDSALWLLLKAEGDFPLGEDPRAHYFGPEDLVFAQNPDGNGAPGGYGTSYAFTGVAEDGKLTMLLRYSITLTAEDSLLGGGEAELQLENLMYSDQVLVEGEWTLPFTIRPVEEQPLLTVDSALVPAFDHENGVRAVTTEIKNIRVSATGVRFIQPAGEQMYYPNLTGILLADGTEVRMDGGGSRWTEGEGTGNWSSDYQWELPLDLNQAEALRFGDTLVPLK